MIHNSPCFYSQIQFESNFQLFHTYLCNSWLLLNKCWTVLRHLEKAHGKICHSRTMLLTVSSTWKKLPAVTCGGAISLKQTKEPKGHKIKVSFPSHSDTTCMTVSLKTSRQHTQSLKQLNRLLTIGPLGQYILAFKANLHFFVYLSKLTPAYFAFLAAVFCFTSSNFHLTQSLLFSLSRFFCTSACHSRPSSKLLFSWTVR